MGAAQDAQGTGTGTRAVRAGGRGARERILRAATELFYQQGINSTGVEQLAVSAHVSKRTLYQHFPSKDDLIGAYLRRLDENGPGLPGELVAPSPAPARERLLMIFDQPAGADTSRGCPFLNAASEIADPEHPARVIAGQHKRAFIAGLRSLAREAGAPDPNTLAHRLALLSDGARAQGQALNSREPYRYARALAATLIDEALA